MRQVSAESRIKLIGLTAFGFDKIWPIVNLIRAVIKRFMHVIGRLDSVARAAHIWLLMCSRRDLHIFDILAALIAATSYNG